MHTIHRDYDRVPFSPKYPNYYPPQYYSHSDIPTHDDAVHSVEEPIRVVPYRNASQPRKQDFDSSPCQDLEPDSMLATLIVSKEKSNSLERAIEVDSTATLPSEIVNLIISLEDLSQSLSISHKRFLSHQLTRISFSLQTDCLNPEISQKCEIPITSTPSPPPITPRPSNTLPSHSIGYGPPHQTLFTPPGMSTDWSGPGSFPNYDSRPTNLDINHARSASVQYEPNPSFSRQISQEIIYANTSPGVKTSLQDTGAPPPLPPREPGSQVEYHNIPTNRSSKKRIH